MLTTTDFKKGVRILVDGDPYVLVDYTVQTPSARGAATLVRAKIRNIVTGAVFDRTFKAGEKFEEPAVRFHQVQFLYSDGDLCHFMDLASYEQLALGVERLGGELPWLTEGLQLGAVVFEGRVVNIELPAFVEVEVDTVGGGSRADMASGRNLKEAVLVNGVSVRVPLFVEAGERIIVDTRTGAFSRRAQK